MSTTPRTDERAMVWTVAEPREGREMVSADFARELERENAKLREATGNLIDACDGNYAELVAECRSALKL